MKQFDQDFSSHLNGEVTTLCNCWQIQLANGSVMGFTDHDHDIEFNSILHEASSGFESSEVEDSVGMSFDDQEIMGALQSDKITPKDIKARIYDGAKVKHFVVNWNTPTEHALMRTLVMGEISQADHVFKASVKSLTSLLDQTNNLRFQKFCSAVLGDGKCKVGLSEIFKKTGTIQNVLSSKIVEASGLATDVSGWFRSGKLRFTSGNNLGYEIEIVGHNAPQQGSVLCSLNLWESVPDAMQTGDTFEITPGCDKQFSTCKTKFSNSENFRGFPHIPGSEFAMSYAAVSQKMDGGAVFPSKE